MLLALLSLLVLTPDTTLSIVPWPVSVTRTGGAPFPVSGSTPILADAGAEAIAAYLDLLLGVPEGSLWHVPGDPPAPPADSSAAPIRLRLTGDDDLGLEGYRLDVTETSVDIAAASPAGLFYGVQTLRQLMPARVEFDAALQGPMAIPPVRILDHPRFAWRGAMLDVARHFFEVHEVERFIDMMALYKLNRLHLHLSDDQGWRIEIPGRPTLTGIGAATQVGGGPGGFYSVGEFRHLVAYAAERFVEVIPEIDMPGHTNAALSAIPELNCDGVAPEPYTGIRVGFSSLCVDREETFAFVEDVVRAISSETHTDVFHVGGDEVQTLTPEEYRGFMERVQGILRRHGRTLMAWDEVAETAVPVDAGSIIQVWRPQTADTGAHLAGAVARGARLVMSPADRIYVDMKYDSTSVLGLAWAGTNSVRDAYEWDPASFVAGVDPAAVLGVEAPMWGETVTTMEDVEWLLFPRLPGVAEIGWSPQERRDWSAYRQRLAGQAERWNALGINYFPSPDVPWH